MYKITCANNSLRNTIGKKLNFHRSIPLWPFEMSDLHRTVEPNNLITIRKNENLGNFNSVPTFLTSVKVINLKMRCEISVKFQLNIAQQRRCSMLEKKLLCALQIIVFLS